MKSLTQKLLGALCLLTLFGTGRVDAADNDPIAQATNEYNAGNFRAAAEQYQAAVNAGTRSAAVFYNLGNASFRAGAFGQAILNYERALILRPQHPEARANLHLAQDKARALELKPQWWDQFVTRATSRQLSLTASVSFWVAAFCFTAWLMARRGAGIVLLAFCALVIGGGALAALYALETGRSGRHLAIVTGEKIEARVATADNAGSVLALPPGTEIKILSTRGDWIYAALPNDLRGWIPAGSAELVRL